ncbi:MAG: lipid A-modifier LpxR family protein [Pseudomonadota bacterium]
MRAFALGLFLFITALVAQAEERALLGFGGLITNDTLGDGGDRWQTGSIQGSRVLGTSVVPTRPFDLLELRLSGQVITPARLRRPVPGDRRYAGALSAGLHTHWTHSSAEFALGGDLVFVGPQTGLDGLQAAFHDLLNVTQPSDAVRAAQIGNAVRPTLVVEVARPFGLGAATIRPFVEGRAGAETLVRAGADLSFGSLGASDLRVRDAVSGQRYSVIEAEGIGTRWVIGGDIARVTGSVFLPEDGSGPAPEDTRHRLRAGVQWQAATGARGFYGLTYLSEEFAGQPAGQVVGSFNLRLRF